MTRLVTLAVGLVLAGAVSAQPPFVQPGLPGQPPPLPFPPAGQPGVVQFPQPGPPGPVPGSPLDGRWYFRGDPNQPCTIRTAWTPAGPMTLIVNEKGSPAVAQLGRFAARFTVPEWNVVGTIRGNAIVWQNGDFWAR